MPGSSKRWAISPSSWPTGWGAGLLSRRLSWRTDLHRSKAAVLGSAAIRRRRFMQRVLAGILTLALLMTAAAADELADQMKAADDLAGSGKFLEAMDALDDAATLVWDRSP